MPGMARCAPDRSDQAAQPVRPVTPGKMLSRSFPERPAFARGCGMETRPAPRTREYLIAAMIYAAGLAVWFSAIGFKLLVSH